MPWYVIITASGKPLEAMDGSPIVIPGLAEARDWMMPGDQGVEEWQGGFKPLPGKEVVQGD